MLASRTVHQKTLHMENTLSSFSFSQALKYLKEGRAVSRTGWNGKGMYLKLQVPDEHSKMQQPYIYINPVGGELVPWVASQPDLLEEDWMLSPVEFNNL